MLRRLPFAMSSRFGAALGRFGYRVGIRRTVTETQVAFAFPELTRAQVENVSRASYENLGRTSIEAALLEGRTPADVLALFDEAEGWEHVEAALALGKGVLLVSGHVGNWELGASYVAARGHALDVVVRHMSNRLFERYLTRVRSAFGVRVVFDDEAVRHIPRALRENRMIALLSDQGVGGLASTFVPFFGRTAKTPRGPAVFALRLDVPMLFVACVRKPNGKYRFLVEPVQVPLTGDREADSTAIVLRYTEQLEQLVRELPGQYFWQHRRWKYQPDGAPPLPAGM